MPSKWTTRVMWGKFLERQATLKEIDNFIARIYDNGLGIDDNKINKIFEPFYTTKEKNKGIGIGLTIVKSIVEEKMLGKISVNNNKKKGVCFTIKLPL
jgi:signal transduction histidine kinase